MHLSFTSFYQRGFLFPLCSNPPLLIRVSHHPSRNPNGRLRWPSFKALAWAPFWYFSLVAYLFSWRLLVIEWALSQWLPIQVLGRCLSLKPSLPLCPPAAPPPAHAALPSQPHPLLLPLHWLSEQPFCPWACYAATGHSYSHAGTQGAPSGPRRRCARVWQRGPLSNVHNAARECRCRTAAPHIFFPLSMPHRVLGSWRALPRLSALTHLLFSCAPLLPPLPPCAAVHQLLL